MWFFLDGATALEQFPIKEHLEYVVGIPISEGMLEWTQRTPMTGINLRPEKLPALWLHVQKKIKRNNIHIVFTLIFTHTLISELHTNIHSARNHQKFQ